MKFPGRIYLGKQGTYLALYNYYPDIYMACPDSLEEKAERLGHVTYKYGGYGGAIDLFKLKEKSRIPEIELAPKINLNRRWIAGVDQRQDVQYKIKYNTPKELLDLVREDIRKFVKEREESRNKKMPAKNPQVTEENRIKRTPTIIPETRIKEINRYKGMILTPGKPEFTPQCIHHANIDYSKGCITSLVFTGQAIWNWEKKFAKGIFVAPWRECDICYARKDHKSFMKTMYKFEEKSFGKQLKEELLGKAQLKTGSDQIFGRRIKTLRFGKRTEAGSKLTLPQLIKTLEVCADTETSGVLPTRFLEYNKEIAILLRRTNSVVLYDQGLNEFQKGAVSFGCTDEWLREQAIKYAQARVNIAFYLSVANPVIEPTKEDKETIEFIEKHKDKLIGTQILPARYSSKALARKIAGIHWDDSKSNKRLLKEEDPNIENWEYVGGELVPKKFHPFWLDLIADNKGFYRMCHHTKEQVWCGGCYTREGLAVAHKRIKVNSIKKKPKNKKRRNKKETKKKNKHNQLKLF